MSKYQVEKTAPTTYLDARGNAVKGFVVFVHLTDYDESHEVYVPSLDENTVKKAIEKLVTNRDKLANLGATE